MPYLRPKCVVSFVGFWFFSTVVRPRCFGHPHIYIYIYVFYSVYLNSMVFHIADQVQALDTAAGDSSRRGKPMFSAGYHSMNIDFGGEKHGRDNEGDNLRPEAVLTKVCDNSYKLHGSPWVYIVPFCVSECFRARKLWHMKHMKLYLF